MGCYVTVTSHDDLAAFLEIIRHMLQCTHIAYWAVL